MEAEMGFWRIRGAQCCVVALVATAIALAGILATGCGSGSSNELPVNVESAPGLPSLPADDFDPARQLSVFEQFVLTGSETFDESEGSNIDLSAKTNWLPVRTPFPEWSIYRVAGVPDTAAPFQITVKGAVEGLDVGYSDYTNNRWIWANAAGADKVILAVDSTLDVTSENGSFYILCANGGDRSCLLTQLVVLLDDVAPAPAGLDAIPGMKANTIAITWEDPAVTYDPDAGGPEVFEYDAVRIYFRRAEDGAFSLLAELPAGIAEYLHEIEFDDLLFYKVSTVTGAREGRHSSPVESLVNTNPLAGFSIDPDEGDGPESLQFDASASSDPDGGVVAKYSYFREPGQVPFFSTTEPVAQRFVNDIDGFTLFSLVVEDTEGLSSERAYFALNDPEGFVGDHSGPNQRLEVDGYHGFYTVDLYFRINRGFGPFRVELDSNFNGEFADGPGGIPLAGEIAQIPAPGDVELLDIPLPQGHLSGHYTFALRVTDLASGEEATLVIGPYSIIPGSIFDEDFAVGSFAKWSSLGGDRGTKDKDFNVVEVNGNNCVRFGDDEGYGNQVNRYLLAGPFPCLSDFEYFFEFRSHGGCEPYWDGIQVGVAFTDDQGVPGDSDFRNDSQGSAGWGPDFVYSAWDTETSYAYGFSTNALGGNAWREHAISLNSGDAAFVWLRVRFTSDDTGENGWLPHLDDIRIY